jgi:hypothetical protein
LMKRLDKALTHAPPPCRVDVPTLKTITWHPSDLFFKSANKPLSWLRIWTGESVVAQTRTERTHQRVHVGEQDFKIVDRALQNLALVHVRQDTGKTLKRNSPLALQIGVSVLGVLTDKDTDTGGEKTDLVVLVRVNEVLRHGDQRMSRSDAAGPTLTISLDMYKFLFASPVPFRTKHLSRGKSAERPKYSLEKPSDQLHHMCHGTHMHDKSSGSSGLT